jgi:hypothetical protein
MIEDVVLTHPEAPKSSWGDTSLAGAAGRDIVYPINQIPER